MNSDFRVGPWLVQPSLNTISQNDTCSRVEPKMMEVLLCLAAQQQADVFPNLVTLRIEPMRDRLRSDPRFEELVRGMHFPQ